jgi:hypothetical protein
VLGLSGAEAAAAAAVNERPPRTTSSSRARQRARRLPARDAGHLYAARRQRVEGVVDLAFEEAGE